MTSDTDIFKHKYTDGTTQLYFIVADHYGTIMNSEIVYINILKNVYVIIIIIIVYNNNIIQTSINSLSSTILFRDNCSQRENGSYFKDLSLLNRPYN